MNRQNCFPRCNINPEKEFGICGEQGAELVDLPSGSTVYNHQESRNMSSSNNVFNVTIDARSVDDFNKVVKVFSGLSQSMNRGGTVNG